MILERDFPPDLRVENEISALIEQGIEVHVACYTFSKKNSVESYNGYTIHRKKISSFTYKSSVGALKLLFCFKFGSLLSRNFVKNISSMLFMYMTFLWLNLYIKLQKSLI